jgi:hypothetical protein
VHEQAEQSADNGIEDRRVEGEIEACARRPASVE